MAKARTTSIIEHGDFQTPPELCAEVLELLRRRGVEPEVVLEPACGAGGFVIAAARGFPRARIVGVELNETHLAAARKQTTEHGFAERVELHRADFFELDWEEVVAPVAGPLLVLGNPPWVTSDRMRRIDGENLPRRENIKDLPGLDAVTGKGNFDVSEWLLLRLLQVFQGTSTRIAVLCKTAVARRVIEHATAKGLCFDPEGIWEIDAHRHFGASVAACFFVFGTEDARSAVTCDVYPSLDSLLPETTLGASDGLLLSDAAAYERWRELIGTDQFRWRSGVKHDCSRVMELSERSDGFTNGKGEEVELEREFLNPLVKSSALAKGNAGESLRWMIVTQQKIGDDTSEIAERAPKTWEYLQRHSAALASRASSIYRGKPPFSVFGVGPYAFAPWKVAISGLHKRLAFSLVGPRAGKPVVLDDTCYFLGFDSEATARAALALYESPPARELLSSMVFWDAKRPITRALLDRLHLGKLAKLALDGGLLVPDGVTSRQLENLVERATAD